MIGDGLKGMDFYRYATVACLGNIMNTDSSKCDSVSNIYYNHINSYRVMQDYSKVTTHRFFLF